MLAIFGNEIVSLGGESPFPPSCHRINGRPAPPFSKLIFHLIILRRSFSIYRRFTADSTTSKAVGIHLTNPMARVRVRA